MKKAGYLVILVAVMAIGYVIYYFNQYPIDDNQAAIQSGLQKWSNRASGSIKPSVIKSIQLEDTSSYIVLFQTENGDMGYAHLIKGFNGKYKIDHSGYGTNIVSYQKIKTNKGIYGILIGKNPKLKIDHIKTELYSGEYSFESNVKGEERFIAFEKLPENTKQPFPAELTFYDKNGSVIGLSEFQD
ncbi:hypothetical protein [Mesobacillus selenatarsenatis]|uniref:Uncharacterized protein n=1 Tax=Mesobacillus selenatarsenatis (strain DSM 18680 / JCM 14380 / FERM P-15431 / SF-1) TaxID=1321606 RepID=A0A0A8X0P2_MESS1|nr:hypothetical protein [Mesobacillus selenatarsenatis]GAM12799.1 hypothetical protein SAMD00020551_0934 [Mesobacillus selenatarsenatis SF-1]